MEIHDGMQFVLQGRWRSGCVAYIGNIQNKGETAFEAFRAGEADPALAE